MAAFNITKQTVKALDEPLIALKNLTAAKQAYTDRPSAFQLPSGITITFYILYVGMRHIHIPFLLNFVIYFHIAFKKIIFYPI